MDINAMFWHRAKVYFKVKSLYLSNHIHSMVYIVIWTFVVFPPREPTSTCTLFTACLCHIARSHTGSKPKSLNSVSRTLTRPTCIKPLLWLITVPNINNQKPLLLLTMIKLISRYIFCPHLWSKSSTNQNHSPPKEPECVICEKPVCHTEGEVCSECGSVDPQPEATASYLCILCQHEQEVE